MSRRNCRSTKLLGFTVLLSLFCYPTSSFPDFVEKNGLILSGENVCETTVSKGITVMHKHIIAVEQLHNTTCRFGWLSTKPCTIKRMTTKTILMPLPKILWGVSLSCCYGWKQRSENDTKCLKPICYHDCKHGKCVGADTCSCDEGWRGYTCTRDVNECHKDNGGCEQGCLNTPGSRRCGCWRGYTGRPNDPTKCVDIDECKKLPNPCRCPREDPQCNATCINTVGRYKCACQSGYTLTGFNVCIDVDECLVRSENKCSHRCINTHGGYRCACFRGYRGLSKNNYECTDIDECNINNGGCEHRCINLPATYRCVCDKGYKLHPNKKNCTAI